MPQYFHPGVYIEEIERGPQSDRGRADEPPRVPRRSGARTDHAAAGHELQGLSAVVRRRVRRSEVLAVRRERLLRERRDAGVHLPAGRHRCHDRRRSSSATSSFEPAGAGIWGNRVFVKMWPARRRRKTRRRSDFACGSPTGLTIRRRRLRPFDDLKSSPRPDYTEDFDDLVAEESSSDYFGKRLPFIDQAKSETQNQGPDSSAFITWCASRPPPRGATPTKARNCSPAEWTPRRRSA